MSAFGDVQRIVLHGKPWRAAQHLLVSFGGEHPLHLVQRLLGEISGVDHARAEYQCSLGLTRKGLQRAKVPEHVLRLLALKAPAFWQGASLRAASHLGLRGASAPECWRGGFEHGGLDMVFSVHADSEATVSKLLDRVQGANCWGSMRFRTTPMALALPVPQGGTEARTREQWVHFGYRDGLSRIGIEGWTSDQALKQLRPGSRHRAGEFLLGHVADCGANRWVAGPGLRVWPQAVRDFFRNASFGVLQQIEQDVHGFEHYVEAAAARLRGSRFDAPGKDLQREVKGQLCGRYPEGQPLGGSEVSADFDYAQDAQGRVCPFSSHVRRMNPRLPRAGEAIPSAPGSAAHFSRARPLLRRGLSYGPALWAPSGDVKEGAAVPQRGLLAHFFCASIEDQYEHLLGEWADRMPLGNESPPGVRDPLVGLHEPGDDALELLGSQDAAALRLPAMQPFVRTEGLAYLLYPGLGTLRRLADSDLWLDPEEEEL